MTIKPGPALGLKLATPEMLARAPKRLAAMLRTAAPSTPPATLNRSDTAWLPVLGGNDQYPDCTAVALANAAGGRAALNGFNLAITTQQCLNFYGEVVGIDPSNTDALANSDGAFLPDILSTQAASGFVITDEKLVGAWGTLANPMDFQDLRGLAATDGVPILGVSLSLADSETAVWTASPPASAGDPTPGSWGGHALVLWDWEGTGDDSIIRLGTWGTFQPATWGWLKKALGEVHIVLWEQLGLAGLQEEEYEEALADAQAYAAPAIDA